MFVRKDGRILYFESMKAQKNFFKLGRKARETRWTEEYKIEKKSRMAALEHAKEHKDESKESKPAKKPAAKKTAAKKTVAKQ